MIRNCLRVFIVSSVFVDLVRLEYPPILFWHSAGESCCGDESATYTNFLRQQLGHDVYIKSAQIGDNSAVDLVKSLTVHPFDQIKDICKVIQNDPKFANGYNGVGLSQGALFLRGLAQSCPNPPMKNLISLGGPQLGVHHFPRCGPSFGPLCGLLQTSINTLAYSWPFQNYIAPTTYWHDTDEARYKRGSTFLAVINNENQYNANYVINLNNLKRLVLVKYQSDNAIVPNESTWFGYYDKNGVEFPLEQTEIFQKDRLGLQSLKDNGKLLMLLSPLDHLELDPVWFAQNIIPILKEA